MRLERIFTHRAVRFFRVLLPIVVMVLIAIPAWNYYGRMVKKGESAKPGARLPSGISVRTEGFTYSVVEGGKTKYVVHAKQSLGTKDDKYTLQDVDVTVYGHTDQDPTRTISGKNCMYDQKTSDMTCTGNVEVRLDENTVVRTENLIYSHEAAIVIAPDRARIEQPDTIGEANRFEYAMNTGMLKLQGDVRIETADHVEVETGNAVFQQKEYWVTMSDGVFIKSPRGWIRGSSGRATLKPMTYKPTIMAVEGNVTAELQSSVPGQTWRLRSQWMETAVSPAGSPERVKTRGDVEAQKLTADGAQSLLGAEIDATIKDGKVEVIEARQNARMLLGSDQTLDSQRITTDPAGKIRTAGDSVLKLGESTIEGKDFVIENGDETVTFNTLSPAILKRQGGHESSSDQARARFDNRTNTLLELVQNGHFVFRTPEYNGRGQTGRLEDGGNVITLEGAPTVNNSEKRLEAAQIRINQKDNSFVASKNVSTVVKNASEQVLVKAARAEGTGDTVVYTGNVQLWRGEAYIKADRLNVVTGGAAGQGQQNSSVHAEAAAGRKVQSTLQNIRAGSDTLDYDDARGVIRYLGGVRAQKQDMILETPDMTVHLRENNLTEIVASGGVTVIRGDQRGTGDKAVYDAATDVVTLTGKNAQLRDREHGLSQGAMFTLKKKEQAVSVTGANGERTVTKHPVKNDRK